MFTMLEKVREATSIAIKPPRRAGPVPGSAALDHETGHTTEP